MIFAKSHDIFLIYPIFYILQAGHMYACTYIYVYLSIYIFHTYIYHLRGARRIPRARPAPQDPKASSRSWRLRAETVAADGPTSSRRSGQTHIHKYYVTCTYIHRYTYIDTHSYIYIYIHMYIHIICIHIICMYVSLYICAYVYIHVITYIHVFSFIHLYVNRYLHICICTCTSGYICLYRERNILGPKKYPANWPTCR